MHDSQSNSKEQTYLSLAQTLQNILDEKHIQDLTIGKLVDSVGDKGFGLLLIILSLPSALPIPAVGYSTPFGICVAILAAQMLIGRKKVWLPKLLRKIQLPVKFSQKMNYFTSGFLKKSEKVIKPRYCWIHTRWGHSALSIAIFAMAFFMSLPIPGTNTLPAMSVFIIGISIAEEDGLVAIIAAFLSVLAALFSGWLLIYGVEKASELIGAIRN